MSETGRPEAEGADAPEQEGIHFHYIKASYFRVVHADGAHGGLTPRGNIHVNFYSERHPIPKMVVYSVNEDGSVGKEIREERIQRDGPVREVEVGVVMDRAVAKSLVTWLKEKIDFLEPEDETADRNEP